MVKEAPPSPPQLVTRPFCPPADAVQTPQHKTGANDRFLKHRKSKLIFCCKAWKENLRKNQSGQVEVLKVSLAGVCCQLPFYLSASCLSSLKHCTHFIRVCCVLLKAAACTLHSTLCTSRCMSVYCTCTVPNVAHYSALEFTTLHLEFQGFDPWLHPLCHVMVPDGARSEFLLAAHSSPYSSHRLACLAIAFLKSIQNLE